MAAADPHPLEKAAEWIGALRRHLRLVTAVAVLVFAAGAVYILRMPDVFQAATRILVNPQRVSDKYVSSTDSMDSSARLNTLSQQVLSSTRLQAIVDELNLFPALRRTNGREQVLEIMRKHIAIELKQSADGPSSFTITYTGGSAREVAAVTNRLAASFIDSNLNEREQEAQGTTDFLAKELADTKSQLDGFEEQLRVYKLQHLGELPDQMDANMQTLSRLQLQLQANTEAQSRLDHEAFLAKAEPETVLGSSSAAGPSPRQQLQARDAQAHHELAELRARYTDEFPDVLSKQEEVRTLDAQLAHLPAAAPAIGIAAAPADPRQELIARDRARLAAEQRTIEAQIDSYQARVNSAPIREQEISQLLRDYGTAKDHYRSLLDKTYSAQMATELERRQQGGSFTMLDPARAPDAPTGPDRPALLTGWLLLSLAAGAGAAVLREMTDSSVRSEAELREALPDIPLLGVTPRLLVSSPQTSPPFVWARAWSKR